MHLYNYFRICTCMQLQQLYLVLSTPWGIHDVTLSTVRPFSLHSICGHTSSSPIMHIFLTIASDIYFA